MMDWHHLPPLHALSSSPGPEPQLSFTSSLGQHSSSARRRGFGPCWAWKVWAPQTAWRSLPGISSWLELPYNFSCPPFYSPSNPGKSFTWSDIPHWHLKWHQTAMFSQLKPADALTWVSPKEEARKTREVPSWRVRNVVRHWTRLIWGSEISSEITESQNILQQNGPRGIIDIMP